VAGAAWRIRTRLEVLNADSPSVTDAGLAHLRGLTKLSYLGLGGTQVSDAGPAHLKGLTKLSGLDLSRTHITDGGLAHLKGLTISPAWISPTLGSPAPGWRMWRN
jgi:hypothetical protein